MSDNKTYSEQMNQEFTKKLREFMKVLPPYATTFFRGIEQITAARTRLAYANDIKIFYEWLKASNPMFKDTPIRDIPLSTLAELTPYDLEDYMEFLKLHERPCENKLSEAESITQELYSSPAEVTNNERTIKRKMSALRTFYIYFHKKQAIDKNPILQVDLPKLHEKAIIRLDIDEVVSFLDAVESGETLTEHQRAYHKKNMSRDLAMMTLMLGTGIRVSECVGLDINDVDFKNDRIKVVRKGGYEAYVYFGDEVHDALVFYLEHRLTITAKDGHEQALFLSSRRTRICVRNVEFMVKKYAQTVTSMKKITPHKLRSTYGTNLYQETGDIYLVADVLGHKDVNTTKKHYAAIEDNRRRQARNAITLREKKSDNK